MYAHLQYKCIPPGSFSSHLIISMQTKIQKFCERMQMH